MPDLGCIWGRHASRWRRRCSHLWESDPQLAALVAVLHTPCGQGSLHLIKQWSFDDNMTGLKSTIAALARS